MHGVCALENLSHLVGQDHSFDTQISDIQVNLSKRSLVNIYENESTFGLVQYSISLNFNNSSLTAVVSSRHVTDWAAPGLVGGRIPYSVPKFVLNKVYRLQRL